MPPTPPSAARAVLYGSLCMAADSCGVMDMLWGHFGMCASVLRAARSWPAHAVPRPEITGLAVPVAFTLHVPVQRDGGREYEQYEHYGGVLQEEVTKETSMLSLEMLPQGGVFSRRKRKSCACAWHRWRRLRYCTVA